MCLIVFNFNDFIVSGILVNIYLTPRLTGGKMIPISLI